MTSSEIYLDNNATTQPLPEVIEIVARTARDYYGNPSSRHGIGRKARKVLEDCREQIAAIVGATPGELVFTSGGTESNNLAILGLTSGTRGTIAISPGEHPSSLEACQFRQQTGWTLQKLPLRESGLFATESETWRDLAWKDVRLAAVILAHNETGVIQSIDSLVSLSAQHRFPIHLDGVQAVGKIPVRFSDLNVTTLSFGAHKFHGPRGIGGLLIRNKHQLFPGFAVGGHQEAGRRAGTEAVALVAGMAKALEIWHSTQQQRAEYVSQLRDRLEAHLRAIASPIVINGSSTERLANTSNISFPGVDGEALLVALDLEGVCCSLGSACSSGSIEPTPVLVAMGLPPDIYRSAVRFSLSSLTTAEEIDQAVQKIASILQFLR